MLSHHCTALAVFTATAAGTQTVKLKHVASGNVTFSPDMVWVRTGILSVDVAALATMINELNTLHDWYFRDWPVRAGSVVGSLAILFAGQAFVSNALTIIDSTTLAEVASVTFTSQDGNDDYQTWKEHPVPDVALGYFKAGKNS